MIAAASQLKGHHPAAVLCRRQHTPLLLCSGLQNAGGGGTQVDLPDGGVAPEMAITLQVQRSSG